MTREQTLQERELRFNELRSYPHYLGTEGALKEMGAWIDNPDPDVRAFVAKKMRLDGPFHISVYTYIKWSIQPHFQTLIKQQTLL